MSFFVNESIARVAHRDGLKIGGIEPCAETKWLGWCVVIYLEDIIACVIDTDGDVSCGEIITPDELNGYVEDTEAAHLALTSSAKS